MTRPTAAMAHHVLPTSNRTFCPSWCVTAHNAALGEEDWLHSSEPVPLRDGVRARLAMSIDPDTCDVDGPYVLIGDTELTVAEAHTFATSLLALIANIPRS